MTQAEPSLLRPVTLTRVEPLSPIEFSLGWNNGEHYSLSYVETRFHCPCAGCVDENTGQRTLERESILATIHPVGVQPIGRYAISIFWSDGHQTGIYHFDRLYDICKKLGRKLD